MRCMQKRAKNYGNYLIEKALNLIRLSRNYIWWFYGAHFLCMCFKNHFIMNIFIAKMFASCHNVDVLCIHFSLRWSIYDIQVCECVSLSLSLLYNITPLWKPICFWHILLSFYGWYITFTVIAVACERSIEPSRRFAQQYKPKPLYNVCIHFIFGFNNI